MIHTSPVLVIIASVRARRVGPAIAQWVADIGRGRIAAPLEIVDLKDWPLPMDDEPGVPAAHPYDNEHTKAWSAKIAGAAGFVFVTPQYNWGYPAALKNALDHLYKEWSGKPAMIVTYGGHGGGKCARQLRQVLKGLHMRPVRPMPALTLSHASIKANAGAIDPQIVFGRRAPTVRKALARMDAALSGRRRWW